MLELRAQLWLASYWNRMTKVLGKKKIVAAAIRSEDERIREPRERIKAVKGRNIDAEHRTLFSRVDKLGYTFIGSRHCFRAWTSCMSKHYTFNSLQNSLELNSIDDEDSSEEEYQADADKWLLH